METSLLRPICQSISCTCCNRLLLHKPVVPCCSVARALHHNAPTTKPIAPHVAAQPKCWEDSLNDFLHKASDSLSHLKDQGWDEQAFSEKVKKSLMVFLGVFQFGFAIGLVLHSDYPDDEEEGVQDHPLPTPTVVSLCYLLLRNRLIR